MFDLQVSRDRRVVLVRFHGQLTEADFSALEALGRTRTATSEQFDCIFDLSQIHKAALAADFVAQRGSIPQAFPDRARFYVVPQDDLKLMTRLYAAYQEAQGYRPPAIVENLDQAFEALNVTASDFRPIDLP